ncbi:ATP-dependent zinc metalloprotease FtsH [Lyngbya confervoides]|uniref:ATP-dependent zinc metalloprotease FtsH n=1 Tax=Lyngbya confervoides BDU141951 TaxID=1574623 RepID=A0ABD4T023_9CYAN|nr:ATP-dependent zinc metalloprotease FtsH [Lyngbya confervoides]MCM1981922.1 ATP-dependent zinc metalloprotease FtsH [Lyngbya confervoides BDU141951]
MPIETNGENRNAKPNPKRFGGTLLSFLTFLILFNLFLLPALRPGPKRVPYSQFIQQVRAGKVRQALIETNEIRYLLRADPPKTGTSPPNQISSTTDPEDLYVTAPIPSDMDLVQLLEEKNVEFGAPPPDQWAWLGTLLGWLGPPLVFIALWAWILNRSGGMGSAALTVGKSKARIYSEGVTGVTFQDVAGVDEAKAELEEIITFLKHPDKYTRLGAVIPKGVLLVGPPGTGKTLLAKAIAGEAGVPFFSISGAEFIELFVGVGAARVRDLFMQAKQQAPCIVFIDELDALGKTRRSSNSLGGNDEQEQTLNQLLTEMDGFEGNTGVILVAATNRPEVLDPALLRPGRFDRRVVVDHPDKSGRLAILQVHAAKVQLSSEVDLGAIAAQTPGFAGADLANLINEAALLAARQDQETVSMANLNEAIERVIAGLERKSRILNPSEKKIVAYHEVGHAIIGSLMPGASRVQKISIVPRGAGALGYTLQLPEEDRFLMSAPEIRGRLTTLLGGRSAEEVVFGQVSTGASDDIQKVTDLAERMVTLYGMDSKLRPIAFEKTQQQYLEGLQNTRRVISPTVAAQIDQEVNAIIESAHHIAQQILCTNRDLLETMAQSLLHQEILEGKQLQDYLAQSKSPEDLAPWLQTGQLQQPPPAEHPQDPGPDL